MHKFCRGKHVKRGSRRDILLDSSNLILVSQVTNVKGVTKLKRVLVFLVISIKYILIA